MSLPARERGLKLTMASPMWCAPTVAPRAGAWIETDLEEGRREIYLVAPRAGAWIETWPPFRLYHGKVSLPARERGLKLVVRLYDHTLQKSLPARERGLKRFDRQRYGLSG